MRRIRGGTVVLKRLMVRDIVSLLGVGHRARMSPLAAGRTIGVDCFEVEAAFEESP